MFNVGGEYRSFTSSGDLSACYLRAVDQLANADFKIDIAGAGGGMGILVNKPKSGEQAQVCIEGEQQVRAGLALQAGQLVTSAQSGWVVNVSSTTTQKTLGRVVVGCASGMIGVVELNPITAPTV